MAIQPRTDWLQVATRLQACPLCTAGGQYESEYLSTLRLRLSRQDADEAAADLVQTLCAAHMMAFGRVVRQPGEDAQAAWAAHLTRLSQLAEQLDVLDSDSWPMVPECGVCLARNEVVLLCAHRLLVSVGSDDETARCFAEAGGLCAAHFATCWEAGVDRREREALRRVQFDAVRRLGDAIRTRRASGQLDARSAGALARRAIEMTAT